MAPAVARAFYPRGRQEPSGSGVTPGPTDSSEQIFALAANTELPLTPEERAELTRIGAAVWRRNNPGEH